MWSGSKTTFLSLPLPLYPTSSPSPLLPFPSLPPSPPYPSPLSALRSQASRSWIFKVFRRARDVGYIVGLIGVLSIRGIFIYIRNYRLIMLIFLLRRNRCPASERFCPRLDWPLSICLCLFLLLLLLVGIALFGRCWLLCLFVCLFVCRSISCLISILYGECHCIFVCSSWLSKINM